MARVPFAAVVVAVAWSALPAAAPATQDKEALPPGESGPSLLKTYCSSCHGISAKGDGPLADHLRFRPPDLTLFAKRNGGKFDSDRVQRIIDGRNPVKGHGGPEMPAWGDAFKRSGEGYSEEAVKARIKALADYLDRIQAK